MLATMPLGRPPPLKALRSACWPAKPPESRRLARAATTVIPAAVKLRFRLGTSCSATTDSQQSSQCLCLCLLDLATCPVSPGEALSKAPDGRGMASLCHQLCGCLTENLCWPWAVQMCHLANRSRLTATQSIGLRDVDSYKQVLLGIPQYITFRMCCSWDGAPARKAECCSAVSVACTEGKSVKLARLRQTTARWISG